MSDMLLNNVMESIKEKPENSKSLFLGRRKVWLFASACLILTAVSIVGSITLANLFNKQGLIHVHVLDAAFAANLSGKAGEYVGSKTGQTYYFPWCGLARRIKDTNLVWFSDRASAELKGYKASSNCHGLK